MRKVIKAFFTFIYILGMYFTTLAFCGLFSEVTDLVAQTKKKEDFIVTPASITVEGLQRVKRDELLVIAGLDRENGFFDLSERKLELYIKSNGWVRRCNVKKIFPNKIKILIEEHKPAIIVNSREEHNGKAVETLWFADRSGIIFKKVFPRENMDGLPFFYLQSEESPERRTRFIKEAAVIADEWDKNELCAIRGITFNPMNGYTVECDFNGKYPATLRLGETKDSTALQRRIVSFFSASKSLLKKGVAALEFSFKTDEKGEHIVIGKMVTQHTSGR